MYVLSENTMRISEIAVNICYKIFWLLVPLMFVSYLLLLLQCTFCVWRFKAKNTVFEDAEYAHCNTVYTSTH